MTGVLVALDMAGAVTGPNLLSRRRVPADPAKPIRGFTCLVTSATTLWMPGAHADRPQLHLSATSVWIVPPRCEAIAVMASEGVPVQPAVRAPGARSRATTPRWCGHRRPSRAARPVDRETIRTIHAASRGVYGARRVHAELTQGHGIQVSSDPCASGAEVQALGTAEHRDELRKHEIVMPANTFGLVHLLRCETSATRRRSL